MPKINGDKIGFICGKNGQGKYFMENLTVKEVKHIRRCIRHYAHNHPPIDEKDKFQKNLLDKFLKFGKRRKRQGQLRKKMRDVLKPYVCNHPKCDLDKSLTLDHIKPLSEGGTSNKDNLQWLCQKHHQEKNYEWRLKIKKHELDKLTNELNTIKNN